MKAKGSENIVAFPLAGEQKKQRKKRTKKTVDRIKYFNVSQIRLLRRAAREEAEMDFSKGRIAGIREWMVIDLLTSTGLRVSEAANLRCGDLKIGYGESRLFVREGKGDISGHIVINESLKKHLKGFCQ